MHAAELVESIRSVLNDGNAPVCQFISSPLFWPVAIKGGFENTLRDMVLASLETDIRRRRSQTSLVCTGERTWGGQPQRADILVTSSQEIGEMGEIGEPLGVVELKVNFAHQVMTLLATPQHRDYPTRGIAELRRLVERQSVAPQISGRNAALVAVQFIHDVHGCTDTDKRLARRYSPSECEHRLADLTQQLLELQIQGLRTEKIAQFRLRSFSERGSGSMVALATWPLGAIRP